MGSGIPDHITIEANPDITIEGLDDINVAFGLTTPVQADAQFVIRVPDPVQLGTTSKLDSASKLESASKLDSTAQLQFAVTEPIVTEVAANAALDLKPVVADLCLNLKVSEFPRQRIRHPYSRCYSLRLFGIEVFGLRRSGESKLLVEDHRSSPVIEWGSVDASRFEPGPTGSVQHREVPTATPVVQRRPEPTSPAGGFRISIE